MSRHQHLQLRQQHPVLSHHHLVLSHHHRLLSHHHLLLRPHSHLLRHQHLLFSAWTTLMLTVHSHDQGSNDHTRVYWHMLCVSAVMIRCLHYLFIDDDSWLRSSRRWLEGYTILFTTPNTVCMSQTIGSYDIALFSQSTYCCIIDLTHYVEGIDVLCTRSPNVCWDTIIFCIDIIIYCWYNSIFSQYTVIYCWDINNFCWDTTIFCRDNSIFSRDNSIFCRDTTIFCWYTIIYCWETNISCRETNICGLSLGWGSWGLSLEMIKVPLLTSEYWHMLLVADIMSKSIHHHTLGCWHMI